MPSVAHLIGTPWVSGGRDAALGLDCWGLIIAAARDCYALALPDYRGYSDGDDLEQTRALFENRSAWLSIERDAELLGDVIVLRLAGTPAHAGLVIDDGVMLHSLRGRNACLERYSSRAWVDRIEGFYRWLPR